MYAKKQILRHDTPVPLPTCMYELKCVYGARSGADHAATTNSLSPTFSQNNHSEPDMAEIIARQEKILQQLADLKKQMLNISSDLKVSPPGNTCSPKTKVKCAPVKTEDLPTLVIHAGPNYPPHSLALVQKLWQDHINLAVTTHLHSTVPSLPKEAQELSDSLQNFKPKTANLPTLSVRLIWNNVGADLELLVSIVPILGEVNVLRYLARCCGNVLSYESLEDRHEIDSLLDVSYLLPRLKTKADRASSLSILNKSLGKSDWLVGRNQVSVADLAAYSAVKQIGSNQLNAALSKWYSRLETAF